MRGTKLGEFKVHEKFGVDVWLSLDRPDQHVLQTGRTSEDRLRDKHRSSDVTSIKNLYDDVYLASFGRKCIKIAFWSDSVNWFEASS